MSGLDDKTYKDAIEAIQATASNHDITLVESEACDLVDSVLKVVESAKGDGWCYDMDKAPKGYDGKKFNYVLFKGVSRSGRIGQDFIYVSGYMDNQRKPVHWYSYKLDILAWKPLELPNTPSEA